MFGFRKIVASGVAALVVTTSPALASCSARTGLTGSWYGDDGGTYRMRREGSHVWWYGETDQWGHVFHGTWSGGDIIEGEWQDLWQPYGTGTLTLRINGEMGVGIRSLERVASSGDGFAGHQWTTRCN